MEKLKLPKKPFKGMKVYCNKCKIDNPSCKHFESQQYRVRIHVSGTRKSVRTRILSSRDYEEAVKEAIDFKKDLVQNNYESLKQTTEGNDYSIIDAILKYKQFLSGEHAYSHKVKKIGVDYQKELIRYCVLFGKSVHKTKNINTTRVVSVTQTDVGIFYKSMESRYMPRTFNKCMISLKMFFDFLIEVEEVEMKNPFARYESKNVQKKNNKIVSQNDFNEILKVVEANNNPIKVLGGKGEKKNMYRTYLINGFKLFLLTGGRREDVVDLKWSDIYTNESTGTMFFMISNKKVNAILKSSDYIKYIPINSDLQDFLNQMGYEEKKHTNEYILFPERTIKSKTIMNDLSKGFTFYKDQYNSDLDISLKNLRKTYITWVNHAMGKETGKLTSHSTEQVLENHYLDPTILSAVEEAALKVRVLR
jgi:integrase